mmetsp:Transcript_31265/g.47709  ORF Transcript_31265/g.47709 Transcript_31265/m.47709 type:complete len:404 (+) Transcript_31265:73-1284(+)
MRTFLFLICFQLSSCFHLQRWNECNHAYVTNLQFSQLRERTEELTNDLMNEQITEIAKELIKPQNIEDLASGGDNFRELRETWLLWLQNGLRDSGLLRWIIDWLTRFSVAPDFYQTNPHCFPEFCRISGYPLWISSFFHHLLNTTATQQEYAVDFQTIRYGSQSNQYAHVMINANATSTDSTPLIVFVHGGAWGSGFPAMYRLTALPFLEKGYRVAILGYRLYPEVLVQGQVNDIAQGVTYLLNQYQNAPTIMIGHSSGAHTSVLANLQGQLDSSNVIGLIGMAGIYDIEQHYDYECLRGVDQISPMRSCCGTTEQKLRQYSPRYMKPTTRLPLLLLHGTNDDVALPRESIMLHESLSSTNVAELALLQGVGHQDTVLQIALGGKTRDTIFNWIQNLGREETR